MFFRYCNKCGEKFYPKGKWCKLCDKCLKDIRYENFINLISYRTNIKGKK